jgi:signal transduction histidine kinase
VVFFTLSAYAAVAVCAAGALLAVVLAQMSGRVDDLIVGRALVALQLLVFAGIAVTLGEARAFSLGLFALVPLAALLVEGQRAAGAWTLVALLVIATILGLEAAGAPLLATDPVDEWWHPVLGWILLTFEVVAIGALVLFLHQRYEDAASALVEERDVLRARRAELTSLAKEQQSTNAHLKALDQEKSDFIGIAVHDLKSPLVSIMGFAQMLKEDASSERDREMSQYIEDASMRMLGLVSKRPDVNAIEQGRLGLDMRRIDAAPFVEALAERYESKLARKHQRIELDLRSVSVFACPERLYQVLDNLLSNAVKYAPHGSMVTVVARPERAGEQPEANGDSVGYAGCPADAVRFEVTDEGPGFNEEDRAKMFGKFSRLSARPTGDESSTGLGLFITKRLVEAMGGTIGVESVYGEGATFVVRLPAAEEAEEVVVA